MKYYGKREEETAFHKAWHLIGLDEQELVIWRGILGGSTRVCQAPEVLAYDLVTQQFHFLVSTLKKNVQVQKNIQRCLHIVLFAIRKNWKQMCIGGQWLNNLKFIHASDYSVVT